MKKWEFTFPTVSRGEWMAQIKKDLQQTTLESLYAEWWPGGKINPFHYSPDGADEHVSLPDDYFVHPPLLAEWFEVASGNESVTNKNILDSLARGAQSIICNVSGDLIPNVTQLSNDVHLAMIDFGINAVTDHFALSKQVLLPSGVHIRIERGEELSEDFIHHAKFLHQHLEGNLLLIYTLPEKENWLEAAAQMFRTISDDFKKWKESGMSNDFLPLCRLLIQPDKLYFKQIIQTRVLQQLWLNLLAFFEKEEIPQSPIECHIVPISDSDPNKYLLRASTSALAAALTGVRAICIHHIQNQQVPEFYKRIDLNIHHLLNLESEIYTGSDPVCGSYALDYYTRLWSEQIWENVGGVDVMNFRQKG